MHKIEIKKSLEREKALLTLAGVLVLLMAPSLMMNWPLFRVKILFMILLSVAFIYRRIKRLNSKISLLTK